MSGPPDAVAVDEVWLGRPLGACVVRLKAGAFAVEPGTGAGLSRWPGTLLPGIVDRHVHLGLTPVPGAGGPVVEVHDLGWDPALARSWRRDGFGDVAVRIAGPLLTAPGGYPLGDGWAPASAVRQLHDEADAAQAVAEAVAGGHDLVKVALHEGRAHLPDAVLERVVRDAHAAGRPVAVHAQGPGQPERALAAGADLLAHTPWTDALSDAALDAMAERMVWISTLTAFGPLAARRVQRTAAGFVARGGRILYGTDAGNGFAAVAPKRAEIDALARLLPVDALLEALTGGPGTALRPGRAVLVPGRLPTAPGGVARWIARGRRVPAGAIAATE